jgi:F-type H+-transporting ATPase subunit delta
MVSSSIAKSYAKALLEIALEKKQVDIFEQDLKEIYNLLSSEKSIWEFFVSPRVTKQAKQETLKKVFSRKIDETLLNALLLLIKNDRILFLPDIISQYSQLNDLQKGIIRAEVISAAKLQTKEINEIKSWFLSNFKATECVLKESVKSELIGGFIVKYGDLVVDRSIKRKMENLKAHILGDMQTLLSKDKVGAYYEN